MSEINNGAVGGASGSGRRRQGSTVESISDVLGQGLGGLIEPSSAGSTAIGRPQEIPLGLIDEDPNQPRITFDAEAMEELARTIRERGVKTPISVRPHPSDAGRFMINHGARRYRASKMAGKATIPGFIDTDHNEADQMIENLQRDNLTAREIADFIGREVSKGKKKGDIAKSIGKSGAYVSQHVALLDLPEPIAVAFNAGLCSDVTLVVELARLFKVDAKAVESHLADNEEFTRSGVRLLKEYIEARKTVVPPEPDPPATQSDGEESQGAKADKFSKAIVLIQHDGRKARLLLTRRPSEEGQCWIKFDDDGNTIEVAVATVGIVAVIEG
jgi:ParB family transcriptional regulator, chromosome partitioning protein